MATTKLVYFLVSITAFWGCLRTLPCQAARKSCRPLGTVGALELRSKLSSPSSELHRLLLLLNEEAAKVGKGSASYLSDKQMDEIRRYEGVPSLSHLDVHQFYGNLLKRMKGEVRNAYLVASAAEVADRANLSEIHSQMMKTDDLSTQKIGRPEIERLIYNSLDPEGPVPQIVSTQTLVQLVAMKTLGERIKTLEHKLWLAKQTPEMGALLGALRPLIKSKSSYTATEVTQVEREIKSLQKQIAALTDKLDKENKKEQQQLDRWNAEFTTLVSALPLGFLKSPTRSLAAMENTSQDNQILSCCGGACAHCPFNRGLKGLTPGEQLPSFTPLGTAPSLVYYQAEAEFKRINRNVKLRTSKSILGD